MDAKFSCLNTCTIANGAGIKQKKQRGYRCSIKQFDVF